MSLLPRARCSVLVLVAGVVLTSVRLDAAPEIPKGRVLEKVACASDANQTYALYIPTSFDPARKSPVLFCFDPGARGKAPVERFQAAAEKFGWIVAGSNNSRNGPWDANATAINAMVGDVNRFLPIDPKRIYVAGLSGGARVACQVAMSGMPQGVIACSAGFMGEIPGKVPFAFFGTAGITDFNHRELRRTDGELEQRRAVHRVVIFDGGHEWLPASLASEALAWFELQAMRTGTREKNPTWIAAQLAERVAAVPLQPPLENYRGLKAVAADFKGVADTGPIEKNVAALAKSAAVRDADKAERAVERKEENLVATLMSAAGEGSVSTARKTVADLQTKAKSADAMERALATRVMQSVASGCSEGAREAMREREFDLAVSLLEMATLVRPERAQTHFDLARARAELGDRKRALAALQQAVAHGFKDAPRLREEKAFEKLRADPEFVALMSAISQK
jgi:hypothetical protein